MRILDLRWPVFEYHNHNTSNDFEDMCRRLFTAKYLENKVIPHTEHNTPGIEVLPALEVEHEDGQPQKLISFQAKYCNNVADAYKFFLNSAKITVDKWQGKLDVVYLFCNKTLTTRSKSYSKIVDTLKNAGIEAIPISNNDLLDLVGQYPRIANYYFGNNPCVIPISAKTSTKKQFKYELIDKIEELAESMVSHDMRFPVKWSKIRSELHEMGQGRSSYYISQEDYYSICQKYGVENRDIQNWLLDWFNDLGDCFSYYKSSE